MRGAVARNLGALAAGVVLLGLLAALTPPSRLRITANHSLTGSAVLPVCTSPWHPAVGFALSMALLVVLYAAFVALVWPRFHVVVVRGEDPVSAAHRQTLSRLFAAAKAFAIGAMLGLVFLALIQRRRVEQRLVSELAECQAAEAGGAGAPPPSAAVDAPAVPSVVPSAGDAAAPSTDPSADPPADPSAAPVYPPLATQIPDDCKDPRVVLTARSTVHEAAVWAQQFLVVNREYRLVESQPTEPNAVEIYQTQYGDKLFAQEAPPPRRAVVGRCFDAGTCNRLAAAFKVAVPGTVPLPACGMPPLESPWHSETPVQHVPELDANELVRATNTSSWPAPCARIGACMAQMGKNAPPDCVGIKGPRQRECAGLPTCAVVVTCVGE